jgi:hypothetical protein
MVKRIYISEEQLQTLLDSSNEKEEVTFYEFFVRAKQFLKDLLQNPSSAKVDGLLSRNGVTKNELINKMKEIGMLKSSEKIDEIQKEGTDKKVAKRYVQYKVPKSRFKEKMQELYKDFFPSQEAIQETDCGGVMQGGGGNPDAGQFTVPFGDVQRRDFYGDTLKRNKDEKNGSMSINRNE